MQYSIAAPHSHKKNKLPDFCHSQNIKAIPDCGKTPTAGFDKQGVLWVVYVDGKHIKLVSSIDLAESYSEAITINPIAEKIYADGENRPKIAFGNNNEIYLSWVKKTEGRYTGDIRFSRSLDNGKTFSKPITINDDGLLTSHRFDTLAVSPGGKVHLTWLDKRDLVFARKAGKKYVGAALYHSVSTDGGATFSKNKKIADHSCECCRISIGFNQNGDAIALWRHVFNGMIRDHAIVNLDSNDDIPAIERVTFDNWKINACPHHGPDMAISEKDELHLAWFTGLPERGGLFYGRYNQNTNKLEKQVKIDSSSTASRPQILFNNKQVIYAWKVFEQEKTKLQVKTSTDNGDSWSETVTVATTAAGSDHPLLFQRDDNIYISWWTEKEGFRVFPVSSKLIDKEVSLKPFYKDSLSLIESQYKNSDFLFVLWSLDCPPCFKELEFLASYIKKENTPKLVLVSTDGYESEEESKSVLKQYGLENIENWYFDDTPALLRLKIDANWYGELPRSYFYSKNGERFSKSGLLSEEDLNSWLLVK